MKLPPFAREPFGIRWKNGRFTSKFPSVQKLLDYLWLRKTGSVNTIIGYCGIFSKFYKWVRESPWVRSKFPSKQVSSPDDLISWQREELEILIQRYLDELRSRSMEHGLSARYMNTTLACFKAFFRVNGFCRENNNELRVQSYHQPPRTRNRRQYVPTLSEVMIMAERAGSARNRAIILALLSTGLRNTALRALRVGDVIKEIQSGQENLLIKIEAEWNRLRIPGSAKGAIPYYTFTSAKATEAIKEMLRRRAEKLGQILEDEYLFLSGGTHQNKKKHLSNNELLNIVKCAAIEAGIKKWRNVTPHGLRKVFESVLRSPTNDGGRMDSKDQEFLMGHILPGSQDPYYDWTKINNLRAQFAKLVFEDKMTPEQQKLSMHENVAKILEIDVAKVKSEKEKALGRGLLVKEELEMIERAIKKKTSPLRNEKEQKIVPKNELEAYLNKGWKYVVSVDEKLTIVEKPLSDFDEDTSLSIS